MRGRICQALEAWLDAGCRRMGEVGIEFHGGSCRLTHHDDANTEALKVFTRPGDAAVLAKFDDGGRFRPLKTAPTLRHGWELRLDGIESLREALDHFYPAMLALRLAVEDGSIRPVDLRETLQRQSGMYAVSKKITDEDADALIGAFCRSERGCLKTILWRIAPERPVTSLPASKFDLAVDQTGRPGPPFPLPCHEACNFLVAAARTVVRKEPRPLET